MNSMLFFFLRGGISKIPPHMGVKLMECMGVMEGARSAERRG